MMTFRRGRDVVTETSVIASFERKEDRNETRAVSHLGCSNNDMDCKRGRVPKR